MKQVWFARFDAQGHYWFIGACADSAPELKDTDVYVGRVDPSMQYHDLSTGQPADMPPRPSREHTFNFKTKAWQIDTDAAWVRVRKKRDSLLRATDWTQLPDAPTAGSEVWRKYRQALRDVTKQSDPSAIAWPTPPSI